MEAELLSGTVAFKSCTSFLESSLNVEVVAFL